MNKVKIKGIRTTRGSPYTWEFAVDGRSICLKYRNLMKRCIEKTDLIQYNDSKNTEKVDLLKLIECIKKVISKGGKVTPKKKYLQAEIKILNDAFVAVCVDDDGFGFYFNTKTRRGFSQEDAEFGFKSEWGANDTKTENILCEIAYLMHQFAQEKQGKTSKMIRIVRDKASQKKQLSQTKAG